MVTEKQLEVLTHIVDSNNRDPSYPDLLDLLQDPETQSKTLDAIQEKINEILAKPLPRRWWIARLFRLGRPENTVAVLHTRLRTQFKAYLDTQTLPSTMINPTLQGTLITEGHIVKSTDTTQSGDSGRTTGSDSSIRTLYMIHRFASDELLSEENFNNMLLFQAHQYKEHHDEKLLMNAIIALMGYYSNHLKEYNKDNIDSIEKHFHKLRLLSIIEWTTRKGFARLVEAITTLQQRVDKNNLAFNDPDNKLAQQELLSWIEVLSYAIKVEESPAAMRFIFNFLAETENPVEQHRNDYVKKLDYFKSFFLGSNFADINTAVCVAINDADLAFRKNLTALKQPPNDENWNSFNVMLTEIRDILRVIYNELSALWTENAKSSSYLPKYDLKQYTPSEAENKLYVDSLKNAFKFLAQNLSSSSRPSTWQSDEPLRHSSSSKSTLGFTPQEWDNSTKGKRHSTRSDKSPSLPPSHSHVSFSGSNPDLAALASSGESSNSAKHHSAKLN